MLTSDGTSSAALVTSDGGIQGGGGGGGGGAKTQLLSWGGYVSGSNIFLDAYGPASGGVVSATPNEESTIVALYTGTITVVGLSLSSGNTNQDWQIHIDGVSAVTVEPTTTESLHYDTHTVSVAVTKGELLTCKLNAGSAGAESLITAILEAS